jgi:hypothetical protein
MWTVKLTVLISTTTFLIILAGWVDASSKNMHPHSNPTRALQQAGSTFYFKINDYDLPETFPQISNESALTRQEMFLFADENNDMRLSLEEWNREFARWADPSIIKSEAAFSHLDSDRDGSIIPSEFPIPLMYRYLPFHAAYVDLDDDGYISPSECNAIRLQAEVALLPGYIKAGPGCHLADVDKDGRVSTNEYMECCGFPKRPLNWFEQKMWQPKIASPLTTVRPKLAEQTEIQQKNKVHFEQKLTSNASSTNKGNIDTSEENEFIIVDANKDTFISFSEFSGYYQIKDPDKSQEDFIDSFKRQDTNSDGKITWTEFDGPKKKLSMRDMQEKSVIVKEDSRDPRVAGWGLGTE